ncbi:MAG: anti-sigma factor [Cobetia crustatorum]
MHESFDLSDPHLREAAAGEYALGTLTRDERAAFESLLSVSHDVQRDVERWREHLNVFNEQLTPVAPPASVWQGIASATGIARQPWWRRLGLWQGMTATAFSLALAVSLTFSLGQSESMESDYVYVVNNPDSTPGWIVNASHQGEMMVQAVRPDMPRPGKVCELWIMTKDGNKPMSLGILPHSGTMKIEIPREYLAAFPSSDLVITLESPEGAPSGEQMGPTLRKGQFTPVEGRHIL